VSLAIGKLVRLQYVTVMKKLIGTRVPMGDLNVSYALKSTSLVGPYKGTYKTIDSSTLERATIMEVMVIEPKRSCGLDLARPPRLETS
jgi:hypothetical protein